MSRGIRVAGRSGWSIESAASDVRGSMRPRISNMEPVNGLELFEFELEALGAGLTGSRVRTAVDAPGSSIEGHTQFDAKENCFYLTLSEATYARLLRGESRGLFTLCHEIGHLTLHQEELRRMGQLPRRELMLERGSDTHPVYADSEWQADRFASALLMPATGLEQLRLKNRLDEDEVARAYHASYEAVQYRINAFIKDGPDLLRAWK